MYEGLEQCVQALIERRGVELSQDTAARRYLIRLLEAMLDRIEALESDSLTCSRLGYGSGSGWAVDCAQLELEDIQE